MNSWDRIEPSFEVRRALEATMLAVQKQERHDAIQAIIHRYAPDGRVNVEMMGPIAWKLIELKVVNIDNFSAMVASNRMVSVPVEIMDGMMINGDPALVIRAILRAYLPNMPWNDIVIHVSARQHDSGFTDWIVSLEAHGNTMDLGIICTCAELIDERMMAKIVLLVG